MATVEDGGTVRGSLALRDYFAGQALAGIAGAVRGEEVADLGTVGVARAAAVLAYAMADQMLARRRG